jgi:hypothetical protein
VVDPGLVVTVGPSLVPVMVIVRVPLVVAPVVSLMV